MVSKGVHPQRYSGRKRKHRREDSFNSVQDSARLKRAQGEKDLNQMDQSLESVDLISQLPDHVIHHILSLLRNVRDAVRTSILSKRWRALWCSFSVLVFDERRFAAGIEQGDSSSKEKMFRDHVSDSLQVHLENNVYIQKLVVHMTSFGLAAAPHVDHWLSVAIAKNIKELDLHVGVKDRKRYIIPQAVFSSKSLTGLRLSGCKLETCNNIVLPHLRKLCLRKLNLPEHIIQSLISSCHSIEDLRFIHCSGLILLKISNLFRLNRVDIYHCNQLRKVELSAPNLHTFWFCGKKSTPCKVNLEGCESLRRLTLEHPQVTRDFCENHFSDFPLLEKLDIGISKNMKYIMISNPNLQKVVLKGCNKLSFVLINAPSLLSLEYKGEKMPYIEIYPFSLTEAKLSCEPLPKFKDAAYRVRAFIKKFDPERFKLVLHSNKHIVIHEDLNCVNLPPFPDLSLEIIKSSACIEDILHGLLRTSHTVSLSVIAPPDSRFPKIVYEMLKDNKDPICCRYNSLNNKCWRHFLKDVEFEDLNHIDHMDAEANEDKRTSAWDNWLKSSDFKLQCQMANLRLYWNTHQRAVETEGFRND